MEATRIISSPYPERKGAKSHACHEANDLGYIYGF